MTQPRERSGITVVIPHIPTRPKLLLRAVLSVEEQDLPADGIIIVTDHDKQGAGPTRSRGLAQVQTPWVAFLDDDDFMYAEHLRLLMNVAESTGADVVVPWFETNGFDPFPQNRGRAYDPADHHTFPITCLVRMAAIRGATFPEAAGPWCSGDDEVFWQTLAAGGARIECVPDATWFWDHRSGNTSGVPGRW